MSAFIALLTSVILAELIVRGIAYSLFVVHVQWGAAYGEGWRVSLLTLYSKEILRRVFTGGKVQPVWRLFLPMEHAHNHRIEARRFGYTRAILYWMYIITIASSYCIITAVLPLWPGWIVLFKDLWLQVNRHGLDALGNILATRWFLYNGMVLASLIQDYLWAWLLAGMVLMGADLCMWWIYLDLNSHDFKRDNNAV